MMTTAKLNEFALKQASTPAYAITTPANAGQNILARLKTAEFKAIAIHQVFFTDQFNHKHLPGRHVQCVNHIQRRVGYPESANIKYSPTKPMWPGEGG